MKNNRKLLIYTFISVLITVFAIGIVGINLSLRYIHDSYIAIQLDVNKQQAEIMARMLEKELVSGVAQETLIEKLQNSIIGTDTEKGFLCMFDQDGAKLVCHPNPKMVGMQMPDDMLFQKIDSKKPSKVVDIIKNENYGAGLLNKGKATDITYMTRVKGTNWMLSAHQNIELINEAIEMQKLRFGIGFGILGVLIAIASTFAARGVSRRYERQIEEKNEQLDKNYKELSILHADLHQSKEEIEAQRDEIESQRDRILKHHDIVLKQKNEITASIQYAKRIQSAVLPPEELLKKSLRNYFVLFKPKDIVSGDFYWLTQIENKTIFAAVDCTGHGVPGAFMSMLGISLLNEIVNRQPKIQANQILNELRTKIKSSLRQTGKSGEAKDGMDMALCLIDETTNQMQFAGAYNPLYLVREKTKFNEEQLSECRQFKIDNFENILLVEIKADRMPIGIYLAEKEEFTNNSLQLIEGDSLYVFSDGFVDQPGGEKGRKYLSSNFKTLISKISEKPVNKQLEILDEEFVNWREKGFELFEQVDDVLVIGYKIQKP